MEYVKGEYGGSYKGYGGLNVEDGGSSPEEELNELQEALGQSMVDVSKRLYHETTPISDLFASDGPNIHMLAENGIMDRVPNPPRPMSMEELNRMNYNNGILPF